MTTLAPRDLGVRRCRMCGCTDDRACPGGCYWIEVDLCSACGAPGYWMHETTGVLHPAIEAYLDGGTLTQEHIVTLRAYLRQWIAAPTWQGPLIAILRENIDDLTSRAAISRWIAIAIDAGVDPL